MFAALLAVCNVVGKIVMGIVFDMLRRLAPIWNLFYFKNVGTNYDLIFTAWGIIGGLVGLISF